MRGQRQLMRIGQGCNTAAFRQTATDGHVWLQYINGAALNEVAEVETGELAFASGNRDARCGADPSRAAVVVGVDGFFKPE